MEGDKDIWINHAIQQENKHLQTYLQQSKEVFETKSLSEFQLTDKLGSVE